MVGTIIGVIECRTVDRSAEGERWKDILVAETKGVLWEPVPGRSGQHIPVEIGADGQARDETEENLFRKTEDDAEDEQDVEYRVGTHNLHTARKATNKYVTTDGCPSCNATNRRGHMPGRLGCNRSMVC